VLSSKCAACSVKWPDSFLGHCQQYRCAANFTRMPLHISSGDKRNYRKTLHQAWTPRINDAPYDRTIKLRPTTSHPHLFQGTIQTGVQALCHHFTLFLRLSFKLAIFYQVWSHNIQFSLTSFNLHWRLSFQKRSLVYSAPPPPPRIYNYSFVNFIFSFNPTFPLWTYNGIFDVLITEGKR
jgi:hypothetical protein